MPAKSEKQAIAARIARGVQKGEVKPKAGSASAEMAKMSPKKLKHFTHTNESTCRVCGGDGWYVEPDEKGEPKQVQCDACQGQGGHKDPEPRLRPSGEPENEPFFESMKLRDIIKEIIGKPQPMTLNGKPIDTDSISIEGIDPSDRPDFVDAYISYAEYKDGTPLTDAEVDKLSQEQGAWINAAINSDTRYL